MRNLNVTNQKGRSMIEMLGDLAIIGVLSVGGIAGYSKAMMKYRINKTIEQITLITGNMRTFFANQSDYSDAMCLCTNSTCGYDDNATDGCPVIKKAQILPDEMITVENGKIMSITNPFGGGVQIYSGLNGDSNKSFALDYSSIPQEACIELATHDWSVLGINLVGIVPDGDYFAATPVSIDIAVKYCSKDQVELFFVYNADPTNGSYPLAE